MEYLLFVLYLLLFAWLVTKIKFFTLSGLTKGQLTILFLVKVMAGVFYGWIGLYYGQMAMASDTWQYHTESLHEYVLLRQNPHDFISSFFQTTSMDGYTKFLSTHDSWWNDAKANFLIKVMALFNLFSFGHYFVNVIFYCFLSFFGPVAFFRVMHDVFPEKKWTVLIASFLVPSFLYWTSGLHKEGLIFVGFALLIYHFYFGFQQGRFPLYRILCIILGFLLILILRNFLALAILPPLAGWTLARRLKARALIAHALVSVLFLVFFFMAKYLHPKLDFARAAVERQHEFLGLGGGSAVVVNKLEPNFMSFLGYAPQAFCLAFIRPYPSDVRHLQSLAASLEINVLLALFLIFLFCRKRPPGSSLAFLYFCLFLSFWIFMIIGYTVNILGAIVRYRSIAFPFLVVPVVALINWGRIQSLIQKGIRLFNNV